MKPKVAVLIPTLNEEATLGQVIDMVPVRVLSDDGYDTALYMSLTETLKTLRSKKPLKKTRPCRLSSSRGRDRRCSSRLRLFAQITSL
jgi:hypothetical protein